MDTEHDFASVCDVLIMLVNAVTVLNELVAEAPPGANDAESAPGADDAELVLAVGRIAESRVPGRTTLNPNHIVAPTGDPAAKKTVYFESARTPGPVIGSVVESE